MLKMKFVFTGMTMIILELVLDIQAAHTNETEVKSHHDRTLEKRSMGNLIMPMLGGLTGMGSGGASYSSNSGGTGGGLMGMITSMIGNKMGLGGGGLSQDSYTKPPATDDYGPSSYSYSSSAPSPAMSFSMDFGKMRDTVEKGLRMGRAMVSRGGNLLGRMIQAPMNILLTDMMGSMMLKGMYPDPPPGIPPKYGRQKDPNRCMGNVGSSDEGNGPSREPVYGRDAGTHRETSYPRKPLSHNSLSKFPKTYESGHQTYIETNYPSNPVSQGSYPKSPKAYDNGYQNGYSDEFTGRDSTSFHQPTYSASLKSSAPSYSVGLRSSPQSYSDGSYGSNNGYQDSSPTGLQDGYPLSKYRSQQGDYGNKYRYQDASSGDSMEMQKTHQRGYHGYRQDYQESRPPGLQEAYSESKYRSIETTSSSPVETRGTHLQRDFGSEYRSHKATSINPEGNHKTNQQGYQGSHDSFEGYQENGSIGLRDAYSSNKYRFPQSTSSRPVESYGTRQLGDSGNRNRYHQANSGDSVESHKTYQEGYHGLREDYQESDPAELQDALDTNQQGGSGSQYRSHQTTSDGPVKYSGSRYRSHPVTSGIPEDAYGAYQQGYTGVNYRAQQTTSGGFNEPLETHQQGDSDVQYKYLQATSSIPDEPHETNQQGYYGGKNRFHQAAMGDSRETHKSLQQGYPEENAIFTESYQEEDSGTNRPSSQRSYRGDSSTWSKGHSQNLAQDSIKQEISLPLGRYESTKSLGTIMDNPPTNEYIEDNDQSRHNHGSSDASYHGSQSTGHDGTDHVL